MLKHDKSFFALSMLLGLAIYIAWGPYLMENRQKDTVDINNFPKKFDGWVSEDVPLSKLDLDVLETDNVFVRRYKNSNGDGVYLYVVYSQTNRKVSHPPEICYTGSGITILENIHDAIPVSFNKMVIPVHRLLLENKIFRQIAFYWFKACDSLTSSYWDQQIQIVSNNFLRKRTGSALIRVSVDVVDNDKETAVKKGREFVGLIAPFLFKYLP